MSKYKRQYDRRVAAGLCTKCGGELDDKKLRRCGSCRKKRSKWFKTRRDRKIAKGICRGCLSKPVVKGFTYCQKCKDAFKTYRTKLRDEVFAAYGGPRCQCCKENRVECLQVDHVNNDGAAHRRQIGRTAQALYIWLKRNGYPAGFQILCASCNQIKRVFGYVPEVASHRRHGCHLRREKRSK